MSTMIDPVPSGVRRPTWSVMIPTYNCTVFLRETLESVLLQDPGPDKMQIEVVDDCSSDDPETIVREVAGDRISFIRQKTNQGHVKNFNTCLNRSKGEFVHLLHGDDKVRDGFYRALQKPLLAHPDLGAAFTRYVYIDESGNPKDMSWLEQENAGVLEEWLTRIASQQRIQTPAVVVRRSVYERLGGFDSRVQAVGEDWEMWVRIAAHYPVWYDPEPLAEYRQHSNSLSGGAVRTGLDVRDTRLVIAINAERLEAPHARRVTSRASAWCAHLALDSAKRALLAGKPRTAARQIYEAMRTSQSCAVFVRVAVMPITTLMYMFKRLIFSDTR
jgi:glycosyltransferase involved in cell wall biosynthesis